MRYFFVVARSHLESFVVSIPIIGSKLARMIVRKQYLDRLLPPRPGNRFFAFCPTSLKSLISPNSLPVAKCSDSVEAMQVNLGGLVYIFLGS